MTTSMTIDDLARALHATVTGTNEAVLQRCLDAADVECIAAVDQVVEVTPASEDVPNALYDSVVLQRAVEWFKANDATFGGAGTGETGGLRVPEGFQRHYDALVPLKQQWGLA